MNTPNTNRLATTAKQESGIATYQANGEDVKLSPSIVRRYLVSGGGSVTNEEVMMFISLCKFQHLNPFLREAYLIKYGERNPATMVVGKDVFIKRAKRNPLFEGFEAGVIVIHNDGTLEERSGSYFNKSEETLVGGWARVHLKGYKVPIYESVSMDEYIGRKSNGEVNGQWTSKPATMIRKVALAQCLREAFPEDAAGLYQAEEIPEAQMVDLDENPVIQEEQPVQAQYEDIPIEPINPQDDFNPALDDFNPALAALMND